MADDAIEDLLDTLGDEYAREILAAVAKETRSAKELSEACDISLPTVYRRLELLEEHDLVVSRTLAADDGNHYKVYESDFDSTLIWLEDEEYNVRINHRGNLPDRFSQLWDELHSE